jgi:hypothetical protein
MGYLPHPDGRSIIDSGTNPATYASYGQYSKKDGERIGPYYEWIGRVASIMHPMLDDTPPRLGSLKLKDIKDVARLGWTLKKRGAVNRAPSPTSRACSPWYAGPARPLVRARRVGDAVDQRHHRNLGGAFARHAVLMHHSTGQETGGQWRRGDARGRHGRGRGRNRKAAEGFGAEVR